MGSSIESSAISTMSDHVSMEVSWIQSIISMASN